MSCLFGSVSNGIVNLTDAGCMIERVWQEMPRYFSRIELDIFQVMPNHFHGILIIKEDLRRFPTTPMGSGHEDPAKQQNVAKNSMRLDLDQAEVSLSLLDLIARFKSLTTTQYIRGVRK